MGVIKKIVMMRCGAPSSRHRGDYIKDKVGSDGLIKHDYLPWSGFFSAMMKVSLLEGSF